MKITQQREPGSTKTKRPNSRGQRVSGSTPGSTVELVAGGGHAVERMTLADGAERAVEALEQRRDAPIVPGTVVAPTVEADTTESELTRAAAPVATTTEEPAIEPVTQADIAAAIAEGAATPFEELVPTDGMQTEAPAVEAEAAGKAQAVAEAPELDVGRVKRRG